MPKKKPPKKDEVPQKERFLAAARDAGASNRIEDFDAAFAKVVRAPKSKSRPSEKP
jgi:hypothetical protein